MSTQKNSEPARPCFNAPSFWQCIDALCTACDGQEENVSPVVAFSPVFGGWYHRWIKGNGHRICEAARLWDLLPESEKEARTFAALKQNALK